MLRLSTLAAVLIIGRPGDVHRADSHLPRLGCYSLAVNCASTGRDAPDIASEGLSDPLGAGGHRGMELYGQRRSLGVRGLAFCRTGKAVRP